MVDTLLKHGAQPNDKYRNSTVWGTFLEVLPAHLSDSNHDELLRIVESLLSHGANPQQRIITGQRTQTRKMSEKGGRSQKYQEVQSDIVKSAQQILLEVFGEEETSVLLKKTRKDQTVLPQTVLPQTVLRQTVLPSRSKWWSGRSFRASKKALER